MMAGDDRLKGQTGWRPVMGNAKHIGLKALKLKTLPFERSDKV